MRETISGIGCIENKINNKKFFISSKKDLYSYYKKVMLNPNERLMEDIEIYGKENFIFSIVEKIPSHNHHALAIRKMFWIGHDYANTGTFGYNLNDGSLKAG